MVKEKKEIRKKPNAIQRYLGETIGELRKVSWPTRREALYLTGVVLVVILVFGTILWVLDIVYMKFFSLILS